MTAHATVYWLCEASLEPEDERGSWQHQDGKKHKEMGVKLL